MLRNSAAMVAASEERGARGKRATKEAKMTCHSVTQWIRFAFGDDESGRKGLRESNQSSGNKIQLINSRTVLFYI